MLSLFKRKPKSLTDLSWLGVDIHSHLLPGIDDGSVDLEHSILYIKRLKLLGFHSLFCTPHILKELYPNTQESINYALDLVSTELRRQEIHIQIGAAAEYMIDDGFEISNQLLCLPGKFLLIEMSYLAESPNIEKVIFNLQILGYHIILAHPERYNFYHQNLARYERLKDIGCLFQLNLLSVTGYYGKEVKKAAEYLVKNKLYDLAGTDLHHDKHLNVLEKSVKSGDMYRAIGNYPFKNKKIFSADDTN